jgi:transposase
VAELQAQVAQLQAQLQQVLAENQRLRQELERFTGPPPPPAWVKANSPRPLGEAKPRKKRARSFVRRKEPDAQVTRRVRHQAEHCPDCGRRLTGGWVHARRQVLEVPETPLEVIEHQVVARECGVCHKRVLPKVSAKRLGVSGKRRIGVRLQSLVATLHIVGRMPLRTIQALLKSQYGLCLGGGTLVALLHDTAARGAGLLEEIKQCYRQAPAVNMDETGWRQDGQNGWLWCVVTPECRYFHISHSRSGDVARQLLGEEFAGVLLSDFLSAYHWYEGEHQRCWAHLLRDLRAVKEQHPQDPEVQRWAKELHTLYEQARKKAKEGASLPQWRRARRAAACQQKALLLAAPHRERDGPLRLLAKRVCDFVMELFTFVEHPEVDSDNNAAERALRPMVIARKISGGTRSEEGSQTKAALMSLFGTWLVRGQDPFHACLAMLSA